MIATANISVWPDNSVDVSPLLPGHVVRIREGATVPWDTNPRRRFNVSIDEGQNVTVTWVQYPTKELFLCGNHGVQDCDHKRVARRFMESDPR